MRTTVARAARRPPAVTRAARAKTSAVSFQCFTRTPRDGQRTPTAGGRQRASRSAPGAVLRSAQMPDTGIAVVGAGVVGLAAAARLAPGHPGLILLDRNPRYGMETSSRNSQVIHAG